MRTLLSSILALAVLGTSLPALAETPASCGGVRARKLSLSTDRTRIRFRGDVFAGPGLPDVNGGLSTDLTLALAYEPEANPANQLWTATIPASGFEPIANGIRYRDNSGANGGVTLVLIKNGSAGTRKIIVKRKGAPIPGTAQAGALRLVVGANGGCARTCPVPCTVKGGKLKCTKSTDTTLCGVKSGCELINATDGAYTGRDCLFPYPSNHFLRNDSSTATGKRVSYPREVLPANNAGVHIDPTPYNVLDGFSAGPTIQVYWPQGVNLAASNVPPLTDFGASLDPSSPTVLVEADAAGCQRVSHFGENDVSIGSDGVTPVAPPDQLFIIRPGVRLKSGTRYIVALRGLVGQDGDVIAPSTGFAALRDGTPSGSTAIEARRPGYDAMFAKLENDCGVARGDLQLAWDFTTASDASVQRYLLHMRDETFAGYLAGSAAPAFVVSTVEENPFPGDSPQRICRRVTGTYTVPLYTTFNGPGSVLNLNTATNLPVQNGFATNVPFIVSIPCSLTAGPTPGRAIFYGHGLLGSAGEVTASNLRTLANNYGFVLAATDWQGFSNADLPIVFGFISDLSGFTKLSERLHQGVLNQLILARLLKSSNGFVSHPAFNYSGTPIIDTSDVFYYGISQGGIEGGIVMALSQEATRGVLGVPAANYSTLLHRSRDFEPYFAVLRGSYPDALTRHATLPLIQQLWDRSEPNGWYHTTLGGDLPNTPPHKLLIHMATSDDEVANLGTEIMVRSMGIPQVAPPVKSYFDIPELMAPFDGSAMVESDGHYGPIPLTNIPPSDNNAHGDMRARPAIQAQIDQFLRTNGTVQNFCIGPCDPE